MVDAADDVPDSRKVVAIVGASRSRDKFGNKALRAFAHQGYRVIPVHPTASEIEGHPAYRSVLDIPGPVDMVSLYLHPDAGEGVLEAIAQKGVSEVWVNPGAESPALLARAEALGIRPIVACSIVGVGESPSLY